MVIAKTDLKLYYSGSASKAGPGGPQGGVISSVQVPVQTLAGTVTIANTVFTDITNQQSHNGLTRYACLYLKNTHATQTATSIKMWQSSVTPGRDTIRLGYSGVAANSHDPLLTETNTPAYNVPLSTSESHLDNDRERAGFYVSGERAPIYNLAITLVEIYLKRYGSPTGTLNVRQRSRNSETIRTDYGSIDVSTINNSTPTIYQFAAPGNTFKTREESVISAEYTNGSETNYIAVMRAAGSPVRYMHVLNYDGNNWRNISDFDLCGRLYTAGQSGDMLAPSGINFENPLDVGTAISLPNLAPGSFVPFWLKNEVPSNTPNQTNNTSELAFRFLSPDT
jgi:hypothetical protein